MKKWWDENEKLFSHAYGEQKKGLPKFFAKKRSKMAGWTGIFQKIT